MTIKIIWLFGRALLARSLTHRCVLGLGQLCVVSHVSVTAGAMRKKGRQTRKGKHKDRAVLLVRRTTNEMLMVFTVFYVL